MTSKKSEFITPLENTHPLVLILWTETEYNKETKKTLFYDKFFIHNFKLSKFLAEKTYTSLKRFEKNISGLYCNECSVWESYLRADELETIIKESYDPKGKFSNLILNVCNTSPITDKDDQNIICIDLRRPEINGKEKVYLHDGSPMIFGKSADRAVYYEHKQHVINGLKKYYSNSFKNIHPNNMFELVEKIKKLTSDKKIIENVEYYYEIIDEYRYLNVLKIKSIEELKQKISDVIYAQNFIQHTYNYLIHKINSAASIEAQRKKVSYKGNYENNFPVLG